MTSPSSRLGIRGQLLVAPAVVLILMAVLGLAGCRGLQAAADTAKASAAETKAVEVLRDSNSAPVRRSPLPGARAQPPTNARNSTRWRDEDADVMKESIDGFKEFASSPARPTLRREALAQAALVDEDRGRARASCSRWSTPGRPLPAAAEPLIEVDRGRHRGRRRGQRQARRRPSRPITDAIAARRPGERAAAERLIEHPARPGRAARRRRQPADGAAAGARRPRRCWPAPAGSPRVTSTSTSTSASAASSAPPPPPSRTWSPTCARSRHAGGRIADGDLSADVEPTSERDALGHAFQRMTVEPAPA